MPNFEIYNEKNAPPASRPLLEDSIKAFSMIPNLHGVMAQAPGLLEGYQKLHQLAQETSFTTEQLTVVWQTINVEHECHYCVPAHTAIAYSQNVDKDILEALRNETPLPSPQLEALRTFTLELTRQRGLVSEEQSEAFLQAGFQNRHILEIILILAQKVMSNYTNHVAVTPVDRPFTKFAWEKKTPVAR